MKDTIITARAKKRELKVLLVCLVIAYAINIYAIIRFDRGWEELFTQVGFMVTITLFLYVATAAVRITVWGISKISRRK